jgi:hypothetical protein
MKMKQINNTPTIKAPCVGKSGSPSPNENEGETVASRESNWISDMGLLEQLR